MIRFAATVLLGLAFVPAHSLDLSPYAGKVVVVDFWASWCGPCRQSFPWLNSMHEKYADDGLVIIGVNTDAEREAAERFLDEIPASFAIEYDPAGDVAREFGVIAMPSSYVFGRNGELQARHLGFTWARRDEYESLLLELIDEDSTGSQQESE